MPKKPQQLAKLSRPRLYDALPRERLFSLLDQKRKHPAVWISGPPGAGKTVLVASYLEARNLAGIWYHVDPGDADISTFFYYLTEAAKALSPKKRLLPLLTPEYLPDLAGFARRYFRELFERMPAQGLLVIDNFQFLPEEAPLTRVLGIAISEVPQGTNVVCISRSEPPADLARSVFTEDTVTLAWDDLRLTLSEAEMLARMRSVDPALAQSLYERSGGWAAGLTLTLERMRRGQIAGDAPAGATLDATFDYFATQIFDTVSDVDRKTLLETSIFSSFTADLARHVSGNAAAGDLLDTLCRRQLFTYRRGEHEARFQYHDLFREFLNRRLRETCSAEDLAALNRKSAQFLEERDPAEAAYPLYRAAGAWMEAAEVLRRIAPDLLAQGRWQTLRDWIGELPGDFVAGDPWLLYWLGAARIYEGVSGAREIFESAFEGFERNDNELGQLLSAAWIVRVYYIEYSNFQPLDRWTGRISAVLSRGFRFSEPAHEIHVLGALIIVFTYRQVAHPMAQEVISRLTALLRVDIDPNLLISAATGLMIYHTLAMELAQARAIVDLVDPLLKRQEVTPLNQSWWWMFVGYQHHRAGEREFTEKALEASDRIASANSLRQTEFFSRCFRAYYAVAWREFAKARASVSVLEGTFGENQPMNLAQFSLASYFIAISTGDSQGAAHHARIAVESATKLGAPFFYVAWRAQAAPGLALIGQFDLAKQWLDEAWEASSDSFLECYRAAILQARAYCAVLRGDRARARELLAQSIVMGKKNNAWAYARGTVPMFDWMVQESLEAGIDVPYIQNYVRKFAVPPPKADVPGWPWRVKVYTLGEFRVEVDGEPLAFSRKAPKKPIALLKAIIAFGGKNVPEQKLLDALWPDEAGDAAHEAFAVSLHRLRKLLVHSDVIQLLDGLVSLDAGKCWVDAWALERRIAETDVQPGGTDAFGANPVWQLYQGHFLAEDTDAPWAVSMRARLRSQFLMHLSRSGKRHEKEGRLDVATLLYQKGIDSDDLAEELYQGLMRCHMLQDRRAEAMAVYRRLRQTLSVTLGIQPSPQSEQLFRSIKDE